MDEKFEAMIAGMMIPLKGNKEELSAYAAQLNNEVNNILLNDARIGKLEAAMICALNNLKEKCELEKKLASLGAKTTESGAEIEK